MSNGVTWDYSAAQAQFMSELRRVMQTSRRTMRDEVFRNFRGVMRYVFAMTPPMGGRRSSTRNNGKNVDFAKGKRQGQRAIFADINRAFQPIPAAWRQGASRPGGWERLARQFGPRATREVMQKTQEELWTWYKSRRNNKRRIAGRPRMPAWTISIAFVRKKLLEEQGLTASGWLAGASRFNVGGIPKWITRHAGEVGGSVRVVDTQTELKILVANLTRHSDSSAIQQKLAVAFTAQANNMARSTAELVNRQRIR